MERLDNTWIGEYKKLSAFPNLIDSKLRADRLDDQKKAFIANGFTTNPDLKPAIDREKINQHEAGLKSLQDQIAEQETEPAVVDAYIPRIDELLGNLRMLKAANDGDGDQYIAANIEAFDEPEFRIFNLTGTFFRDWASQHDSDERSEIRILAKEVLDVLPDSISEGGWFTETDFQKLKTVQQSLYEKVAEYEIPDLVSGEVCRNLAQLILREAGFNYNVVPQREGLSTMSVDHSKKEMKIPQAETYTRQRFSGLMMHEGLIHIAERVEGEKQALQILYSGLNRYLRAGEGKGVLAEQIAYDTFEEFKSTKRFFDIARRHFALGLARGTDGNGERDFKEVFKIINSIDRLYEVIQTPEDIEKAGEKAFNKTWELLTMRTHKGVVGKGIASLKDKIYAEGFVEQGGLLLLAPEVFPYLNLGKYNLANTNHVRILKKAGIIPETLMGEDYAAEK